MKERNEGKTQITASAKAGISERSGRNIEHGRFQEKCNKQRTWRTRKDPFEKIWEPYIEQKLKESPELMPITILEEIQEKFPGEYEDSKLRTLQRRIKKWKALNGSEKELMILQKHEPGIQGLSDFTKLKEVEITINEKPFSHLLYHFRLAYSGWSYLKVIHGGESYSALTSGLQEALIELGGTPEEHRTDHLSAAVKNYPNQNRNEFTERYHEFCKHYHIKPTYNNVGKSHENGSVEGPNGHLKRRIKQALLLRKSNDFISVNEYEAFIKEVVRKHNRRNAKKIFIEKEKLQKLPETKACDYDQLTVKVSSSGTINVKRATYSVPSRLINERLRIHLYDDHIEAYLSGTLVYQHERIRPKNHKSRVRIIQLKHVIWSLKRKPHSFRGCRFRDDLFPNEDYKTIWNYLNKYAEVKTANKYMVGLLDLSLKARCKIELAEYVLEKITSPGSTGAFPSLNQLKKRFDASKIDIPEKNNIILFDVKQHELSSYDDCFKINQEVNHG